MKLVSWTLDLNWKGKGVSPFTRGYVVGCLVIGGLWVIVRVAGGV